MYPGTETLRAIGEEEEVEEEDRMEWERGKQRVPARVDEQTVRMMRYRGGSSRDEGGLRWVGPKRKGRGWGGEERNEGKEEWRRREAQCYHRGLNEALVRRAPRDCDTGWNIYKTGSLFCMSCQLTVTFPEFMKYAFHLDFFFHLLFWFLWWNVSLRFFIILSHTQYEWGHIFFRFLTSKLSCCCTRTDSNHRHAQTGLSPPLDYPP